MGSRFHNIVTGILSGMINKLIAVIFPIIIRLVIIRTIGIQYLGLNSVFGSIIGILSITELGFSNAMVYSLYKPLAENDVGKVNALLKFLKHVNCMIGGIIGIVGVIAIPFLDVFISNDTGIDINIILLYLMYLTNTAVGYFLYSYKMCLLIALQRTDINNKILAKVKLAEYMLQLMVLVFLKDYYLFILVMPLGTIVTNLFISRYVNHNYPQYKCEGTLEKSELKVLFRNSGALAGNKINGTLILSADNMVISAFLGVTFVAVYQNYYTIVAALVSFVALIFDALRPSIGNSLVTESIEKNYDDYNSITMLISWISGWCSICLLCLFQPFISLYYGKEYLLDFSTVVLLAFYFFTWKILDVQVLFRDAAGLWWTDRLRPYIVSVANLVINILLVRTIGLNGVILSTVGTQMLISFPWLLVELNKDFFKKGIFSYCLKLIYYFCVIMLAAGLTYLLCQHVNFSSPIIDFLSKACVCAILPNGVIFAFYCKRREFAKIESLYKNLLQRKEGQ